MKHLFHFFCLWWCDVSSEWSFSLIDMPHNSCKKKAHTLLPEYTTKKNKKKNPLKTIPPCILGAHSVHLPKICFFSNDNTKAMYRYINRSMPNKKNLLIPVFGLLSRGRHGLICMGVPLLISSNTPVAGIHTWCLSGTGPVLLFPEFPLSWPFCLELPPPHWKF